MSEQIKKTDNEEPKTLHKFSWGAFFITGIWGLFNRQVLLFAAMTSLFLMMCFSKNVISSLIILTLSLIMRFLYGFTGNQIAWKKRKSDVTASYFDGKAQALNIGGIIFGVLVLLPLLAFILGDLIKNY